MARLFTCGFEFGELIEHNGVIIDESLITQAVQSTVVRSGTYAWKISAIAQGAVYVAAFSQVLAGNPQEVYVRIGFQYSLGVSDASTIFQPIVTLSDAAGNNHLTLALITSTARLNLYRGNTGSIGQTSGTLVGTGTVAFTSDVWHVIEFYAKIADSGGVATIKVSGITDIDFSGDTANSANEYVGTVFFGACGVSAAAEGAADYYYDDIAINDTTGASENTWPGLSGVYLLLPAADGNATTWTRSTGASNWALVDELPNNTTDYVSSSVADAIDQYTLTSLCPAINTINFIEPTFQAALGAAGSAGVFPLVRHSGSDFESASVIVAQATPNYILFKGEPIYTVLGGAGAWTPAQVNALEVGMKIK